MNDMFADFEHEKFEMQKQHTKNIQGILDDTNARLQKMEKEYGQQTTSTVGQRSFPKIEVFAVVEIWIFCGGD